MLERYRVNMKRFSDEARGTGRMYGGYVARAWRRHALHGWLKLGQTT